MDTIKVNWLKSFVLILFINWLHLFFLSHALAQTNSSIIHPLPEKEVDLNSAYFDSLFKDKLNNTQIIGLGEVSHGAHEAFMIKSKLVKYLIEQAGYRTLLLELSDSSLDSLSSYLNSSVAFEDSKIESLLNLTLNYPEQISAARAQEIIDLMIWLKQYNLSHPDKRVALRGIDIFVGFDYFKKKYISSDDWHSIQKEYGIRSLKQDEAIAILNKWYNTRKDSLRNVLGEAGIQLLSMHLRSFKAFMTYSKYGGEKNQKMLKLRDSMMAINAQQLVNEKTIIWAHNLHIANNGFNAFQFKVKMLGNFLHEKYGNGYYVILTDFTGHALVNIISGLKEVKQKVFSSNKRSLANLLLQKYNTSKGIVFSGEFADDKLGYGFNNIGLQGDINFMAGNKYGFDALIYFNNLTPSLLLK